MIQPTHLSNKRRSAVSSPEYEQHELITDNAHVENGTYEQEKFGPSRGSSMEAEVDGVARIGQNRKSPSPHPRRSSRYSRFIDTVSSYDTVGKLSSYDTADTLSRADTIGSHVAKRQKCDTPIGLETTERRSEYTNYLSQFSGSTIGAQVRDEQNTSSMRRYRTSDKPERRSVISYLTFNRYSNIDTSVSDQGETSSDSDSDCTISPAIPHRPTERTHPHSIEHLVSDGPRPFQLNAISNASNQRPPRSSIASCATLETPEERLESPSPGFSMAHLLYDHRYEQPSSSVQKSVVSDPITSGMTRTHSMAYPSASDNPLAHGYAPPTLSSTHNPIAVMHPFETVDTKSSVDTMSSVDTISSVGTRKSAVSYASASSHSSISRTGSPALPPTFLQQASEIPFGAHQAEYASPDMRTYRRQEPTRLPTRSYNTHSTPRANEPFSYLSVRHSPFKSTKALPPPLPDLHGKTDLNGFSCPTSECMRPSGPGLSAAPPRSLPQTSHSRPVESRDEIVTIVMTKEGHRVRVPLNIMTSKAASVSGLTSFVPGTQVCIRRVRRHPPSSPKPGVSSGIPFTPMYLSKAELLSQQKAEAETSLAIPASSARYNSRPRPSPTRPPLTEGVGGGLPASQEARFKNILYGPTSVPPLSRSAATRPSTTAQMSQRFDAGSFATRNVGMKSVLSFSASAFPTALRAAHSLRQVPSGRFSLDSSPAPSEKVNGSPDSPVEEAIEVIDVDALSDCPQSPCVDPQATEPPLSRQSPEDVQVSQDNTNTDLPLAGEQTALHSPPLYRLPSTPDLRSPSTLPPLTHQSPTIPRQSSAATDIAATDVSPTQTGAHSVSGASVLKPSSQTSRRSSPSLPPLKHQSPTVSRAHMPQDLNGVKTSSCSPSTTNAE